MKESLTGTLAIDLGNTNTVVAFQDQKDENSSLIEIPNITSSPGVIPSAVWFEEPSKIPKIGISALKMRDNSNSDLFFHSNFKRLIGNSIEKINQKSWPKISNEKLDQYLNRFRGIIKQIPPKVSSVHVNGERAYKKSFRNEIFELAPKEVKIDELTLMKWDQINGIIEIKIKCSAGTYIRAIARDLGEILNSEGCLLQLKRISACGFDEQNSIKISEMEKEMGGESSKNFIIPIISALNHISTFVLNNEEEINFWQTGRAIKVDINCFQESKSFDYKNPIKVIDKKETLLGIGLLNKDQTTINPKLVLNAK